MKGVTVPVVPSFTLFNNVHTEPVMIYDGGSRGKSLTTQMETLENGSGLKQKTSSLLKTEEKYKQEEKPGELNN